MQPRASSRAFAVLMVATLGVGIWACGAASELNREQEPGGEASPEGAPPDDGPSYDGGYDTGYQDSYTYDTGYQDGYGYDVYPYDGGYDVYPYDGGYDVYPFDVYPYDVEPFDVFPPPFDVSPPPFDVFPPPFDTGPPDSGPPWDGGPPVTIATHEQAEVLALDDTHVYWENSGGTVLDCPLAGCPGNVPTLLAVDGEGYYGFESLAVGDSTAFFLDSSNNISDCVGSGCGVAPTTYEGTSDGGFVYYEALINDASNAYFTDGSNVYSCPLGATCSSPATLYSDPTAYIGTLGVSSTDVFFVRQGTYRDTIRSVPIGGGTDTQICRSYILGDIEAMVVAGGYVYFTTGYDTSSVYQCLASGGGLPTVYATDVGPYGLATDGANLYWTNYIGGVGTVATCALGASCASPRTVASGQDYPQAIAVNASSVFWTTSTSIYSATK